MKNKISLRHLTVLSVCIVLSLISKRIISPLCNIVTDFIRIPGGGAATAFSLMFLIVGTGHIRWRWAATAAAFVQGLIALSLGMSSYQGMFAVITYTLPGIVIDLFRSLCPKRDALYFMLSCGTANLSGAFLTNLLVFHLKGLVFFLWELVAVSMGFLGGLLGYCLFQRISKIADYRRIVL